MKTLVQILFWLCVLATSFGLCIISNTVLVFVDAAHNYSAITHVLAWTAIFLIQVYFIGGVIGRTLKDIDAAFAGRKDVP